MLQRWVERDPLQLTSQNHKEGKNDKRKQKRRTHDPGKGKHSTIRYRKHTRLGWLCHFSGEELFLQGTSSEQGGCQRARLGGLRAKRC